MRYKVLKKFGKYKIGDKLNDTKPEEALIIHRKLQEGGTLEPDGNKKAPETKMDNQEYENKMNNPKDNKKK